MEFDENESVLFQYPASFRGKEGNLYVTSLRIFFHPNSRSSSDAQSYTWANIKSILYSPANDPQQRAGIRFGTVIDEKMQTILLLNADVKAKFAALDKIREIVSEIRKKDSAPTAKDKPSSSSMQIFSHESRGPINDFTSNLMTEQNGKKIIHLTPETKHLIFRRYPAVQKAFNEEVPLKMSEKTFWETFFQSQYYTRPQEDNMNMSGRKLFARYESTAAEKASSSHPQTPLKRPPKLTEGEVDLSATAGDQYSHISSSSQGPDSEIAHWVNENSSAIITAENGEVAKHLGGMRRGETCDELSEPKREGEHYVPIHLKDKVAVTSTENEEKNENVPTRLLSLDLSRPPNPQLHFPPTKRAKKVLDLEVNRMHKLSHANSYYQGEEQGGGIDESEKSSLDMPTLQEMRVTFNHISELLRHFYVSLRVPDLSPTSKSRQIIEKLQEVAQQLESKKKLLVKEEKGGALRDQAVPVWTHLLSLLNRAKLHWEQIARET